MSRNRITRLMRSALAIAAIAGAGLASANAQVVVDRTGVDVLPQADRWLYTPAQELFMGQTAQTQHAGGLQLSAAADHIRYGDNRQNEFRIRGEYGITDNIEANIEMPLSVYDRPGQFEAQSAVNHLGVGAKLNVLESTAPVAVSTGLDVEIPLRGGRDVTGSALDAGPMFKPHAEISSDVGPAMLNASAVAELGQPTRAINYSVGSMFDLGRLTPTVELSSRAIENQRPEFYATPGLYYHFNDR